jgi:uncharacterized protein (DUF1684 family)
MIRAFVFILLLLTFSCTRKSDYENKVDKFRAQTIGFYVNPNETPLDSSELASFKGIHYYPINENFRIEGTLLTLPQLGFAELRHSKGDYRKYIRLGEVRFKLEGKSFSLTAYQTEEQSKKHELFIPFADETNGKETYAGGRYIDVSYEPASDKVILDFNFAYSPYCAYSHRYSCAMVPSENTLHEYIRAGEKMAEPH